MKFFSIVSFLTALGFIQSCNGSRILVIYTLPVRSHFILINQLLKGLAHKGHEVDIVNVYPPSEEKIPNYNQILTLSITKQLNLKSLTNNTFDFIKSYRQNPKFVTLVGNDICKAVFGNPEFMKLIKDSSESRPYDLIMLQAYTTNCLMMVGHLWKIPIVLVSTTSLYPWMHDMIGNPENIAFSSNYMMGLPTDNNFYSRFLNFYYFYMFKFNYLYYSREQNKLLKEYFGPSVPTIRELEQSVSLILLNSYFPVNDAKPMTTGVVEIGGLHIKNDTSELDDDLKKWLDESKYGVIYFSFGSMFRTESIPVEILDIIFKTLGKMAPKRVLIRILKPEKLPLELPKNFKILSWMPQEKVLQHPNVKVFITHGGTLGTQESIYYEVPMLCVPLFADQWTNAYNYVGKKIATMVDIRSLTQEKFEHALDEILTNPIYRDNIKTLSRMFRDRPQTAMNTAIFWIEFVIRNGKDSLRSAAMDLKWWQIALLDIYAVIILGLLIVLFILKFIMKIILKLIYFKKCNTVSEQKKSN